MRLLKEIQVIILGLFLSVALVSCALIFSKTFLEIKKSTNNVIAITGSAEKRIVSDYIVWRSTVSKRAKDLKTAYVGLEKDLKKVIEYLKSKGVKDGEIIIHQANIEKLYKKTEKGYNTNEIEGYSLSQKIEVRSYDVKKIDEISRKSSELINQGIEFISKAPEYFYTKLADLKIEMLKEATQNAIKRAQAIAKSTGVKIGVLQSARMGVFQITPVNSYEVSWYGENDTTSLEKKVTAVVKVTFSIK